MLKKITISLLWGLSVLIGSGLSFGAEKTEVLPMSSGSPENRVRALLIPKVETILSNEIAARIESVRVDVGDMFKKGQALVVLGCGIYKAQMDKARAELAEAEKTLEVNQRLEKLGSISELEVAVAAAKVDQAKAELAFHRTHVRKCVIYAPFSGRVVKREVDPYQYVNPGQPLLEIIDNHRLELQIFVPSKWLRWIKPSTSFQVHIDEVDREYTARISVLGARVDPVSQTLEIRGKIDGKHPELLAGMSGTAVFEPR
jgi:RND family efflux transporter MFP subunit